MAEPRLNYERLVEDALRSVVREALREVAVRGLPGAHHFYLTFRTDHAGVVMPDYLRAQYPHQMTIVLQHQFWGLEVEDAAFSVTLSFNDRQERLTIPLAAVAYFADPAVAFELRFELGAVKERSIRSIVREPRVAAPARPAGDDKGDDKGADVVTLDAFRKK